MLGTTASPEEEAGSRLEKERNGSGRSNQCRWHFKLCDVRQKHFVLLKFCHLDVYSTWYRDGVGERFIDMGCLLSLWNAQNHQTLCFSNTHKHGHIHTVNKSVCQHRRSRKPNRGLQYADCETITGLLSLECFYLFLLMKCKLPTVTFVHICME